MRKGNLRVLCLMPGLGTALSIAALVLAGACNRSSPTQPLARVPPGTWGGPQISMTVAESGASLQQMCASGTLEEPLLLDAADRFDVAGKYTRQRGGPIGLGDTHSARYTGSTDGRTMILTIMETDDGMRFGPFTLTFAQDTAVNPCPLV